MIISVSKGDCRKGSNYPGFNPVERSLKRRLIKGAKVRACRFNIRIEAHAHSESNLTPPSRVAEALAIFAAGGKMEPVRFELPVPARFIR